MKTKTITIESKIEEKSIMESLLNMKHSGHGEDHLTLILSFHAFANHWKFGKLEYYLNMLREEE